MIRARARVAPLFVAAVLWPRPSAGPRLDCLDNWARVAAVEAAIEAADERARGRSDASAECILERSDFKREERRR